MDAFMSENTIISSNEIQLLKARFLRALQGCKDIWGQYAFKRPDGDGWRDQFLNGLYDAQMIAIDSLDDHAMAKAVKNKLSIVEKTRELFKDEAFDSAVRQGTNNSGKVRLRISTFKELLG